MGAAQVALINNMGATVNMGWSLMWGTSCDLLKPSFFEMGLIKNLHFQKAKLFGFQGVLADVCVGSAMLHGCASTSASTKLALAAFLGIAKQMEAQSSKVWSK